MNKPRRKSLGEILAKLDVAKSELEDLLSEEQDAFDNMPESMQNGDKGQTMQEGIDAIQTVIDNLDDAVNGDVRALADA